MTGAYLRVKRIGKWEKIEIEYLTNNEREEILKDDPRLMKWLHLVCENLVEVESILKEIDKKLSFLPNK